MVNFAHASALLSKDRFVGVRFEGTAKNYTYRTTENFEEGDCAVVEVSGTLKFVKVVEIDAVPDYTATYTHKWIVSKVDLALYNQRKAEEKLLQAELKKWMSGKAKRQLQKELLEELGPMPEELVKLIGRTEV